MKSFTTSKNVLSNGSVLISFNQNYETETSIAGYGSVLLQKSPSDNLLHLVYMIKKTTVPERKYTSRRC